MASVNPASSQAAVNKNSHRLPTVSASEVLQRLGSAISTPISTGLPELDNLLQGQSASSDGKAKGGLARGKVTEIYGPPGVGKSAFALQAACNVLSDGSNVVWLDCGATLPRSRLLDASESTLNRPEGDVPGAAPGDAVDRFKHYVLPSLAHLLALILHPQDDLLKQDTALIVIDSLSTVVDVAYHKHYRASISDRTDAARWASGRRFAVLAQLIAALAKMAVLRNLSVLITSQTVTRVRPGQSAMLLPALSGSEWSAGLSTQLIMFRDWPPRDKSRTQAEKDQWARLRYIGLIKVNGKQCADGGQFEVVVPVTIGESGLQELRMPAEKLSVPITSSPRRGEKRPFDQVGSSDDDGAGSDGDYGWDEDDALAAEGLVIDENSG